MSLIDMAVQSYSRCKKRHKGLTCRRSPIGCCGSSSWCSVLGLSIWVIGIRRHGSNAARRRLAAAPENILPTSETFRRPLVHSL